MKKTISWGIWGTGAIAEHVASDFRVAHGNVLHAVASRALDRAERFAKRHGAAKFYAGLETMLDDPDIDAVYIASPNHRHVEDCLACIEKGKAVLCEKPFALNLAEADRIVEAARRREVFCMEAMWSRFIPAIAEAKRQIGAGKIGPIRMIEGNFSYPAASTGRLFDPEMGGGVLLDRGVYLISLAQYLLGAPSSVRGAATLSSTGVDEQSVYQLGYESGALANFSASLCIRGSNDLLIAGEKGSIRLCEPFYAAYKSVFVRYSRPAPVLEQKSPGESGGSRGVLKNIRRVPALKSAARRLKPLVSMIRRSSQGFAFSGYGYQFELEEVRRCLEEQRTESTIMPLEDSLSVMRTMDELRAQWGLVYPGEK